MFSSSYLICFLICIFTVVKCSSKNFSVSLGVTSVIAVLMVIALIGDLNNGTSGMEIKKTSDSGYYRNQLYPEHSDSHTVWLSLLPSVIHAVGNAGFLSYGIHQNCPQ